LRVTLALLVGRFAHAQTGAPVKKDSNSRQAPTTPVPGLPPGITALDLGTIGGRLGSFEQTLNRTCIDSRLTEIEKSIHENKPSLLTTLLPSLIAFVGALAGVLAGCLVNERIQKTRLENEARLDGEKATLDKELAESKARQERELSEKQAKLQIGSAVIDWEIKQSSQLYMDRCEHCWGNRSAYTVK
jgi:hypothetical protein